MCNLVRPTSITASRSHARAGLLGVQLYPCNCWGFDMADIHFHVWHYKRDPDGVIRSMERRQERYEKRRAANRALEMFHRQHCIAGQVLQCVDGAFCQPPPDWVVQGYTLGGAVRWARSTLSTGRRPSVPPARWNSGWRTWRTTSRRIPTSWYGVQATSNKGQRPAF